MTAKRKVSVSLDDELVSELEASGEPLSGQINDAVVLELERRRRQRRLTELLDALDDEHGPVDEEAVDRFVTLLS